MEKQRSSLVFLKKKPNSRVYSSSTKRAGSFKCGTSYQFELLNNIEEYGHHIGCTGFVGNHDLQQKEHKYYPEFVGFSFGSETRSVILVRKYGIETRPKDDSHRHSKRNNSMEDLVPELSI